MKRFVSYLYSIYNNQKIHNAGFARMELRTGRNRVDIHLKENGYSGKTGTVYLFVRKRENIQGVSIGNITFRGSQADFRYEQAEENIGQTPWQIMQMNGILIVIDDRAAFLSQWDEQPVDTTRFEVWNVDKLNEESVKQGELKEGYENKENINGNRSSKKSQNEDDRERNSVEGGQLKEHNKNRESVEGGQPNGHGQTGKLNENNQNKGSIKEKQPNVSDRNKNGIIEETSANEKDPVEHDLKQGFLYGENRNGENLKNENRKEENVNTVPAAVGSEDTDGDSPEQLMNIQTAELQPQVRNQWNQTWRYMLRMYPVLNQFADNNQILCVRIEIKDVRLLPEKYWSIVNNSFLLHGFFNYRYLVFGKMGQSWFIGIPGVYQNQEHVMASIFGFPDFLPQSRKNERGEQPGYWYRILEI